MKDEYSRTASEKQEFRIRMALVATRHGLYAARPEERQLIAYGQYYGITVADGANYAFEVCGQPRKRESLGRIICLRRNDGQISSAEVIARDLGSGCHQIDLIDGSLYVTDTYNQRLLRLEADGSGLETIYPFALPDPETGRGYAHVNSLLAFGDHFYLLKPNNSLLSGINSEVAVFDRQWVLVETLPLAGQGCHNLAFLDDGSLISCGSMAGEIIGPGHAAIKICDRMTRGLSVG